MNILVGTVLLWIAALAAIAAVRRRSPDRLAELRDQVVSMMIFLLPRIAVGLLGAGFMAELLPTGQMRQLFGDSAGLSGVVLATLAGALTPGGPFIAFAIAAAALTAGAGTAAVIAYTTAWSVICLNRTLAFELPLMGRRFTWIRTAISLPLPVLLALPVLWV